ncbi:FAD-dependent oxidoreductase, partial [Halegenticoccus soli]|uniref:FAD-dependent oxidoreductase n=1 Tax=Halegenticoccus soli TaxID=1985678 RepID=UPI001E3A2670
MYDVIIVGGGIVGASVGYHLSSAGASALLVDRRDPGRATDAGAGIVSPETSRHDSETWYEFAVEAASYYRSLTAELGESGVEETGYSQCGILVASRSEDDTAFSEGRKRIYARRAKSDHPPADRLYDVSPEEARDRFPALGDVPSAIYYEN